MLLLVSIPAAATPENMTPEELALLPRWCRYTQNGSAYNSEAGQQEYRRYLQRYGRGFSHMHHYCYALINIGRSYRSNRTSSPGYLRVQALDDIDYVLNMATQDPDFQFRPEILARKVRLLLQNDDLQKAVRTAEQLITEWPKVPDGYTLLAEIALKAGQKARAQEILSAAEQVVTDKEALARQRSLLKFE